jgi:hypothetical protein
MRLIHICKEKLPTLSAPDGLGVELIDQVSFPMVCGWSGHHRNASGAVPTPDDTNLKVATLQAIPPICFTATSM